jgi:hypothetical protein
MPLMWIAYDPMVINPKRDREQFNGSKPVWGESVADCDAKQGVDVPQVGDELSLRMGVRTVKYRRLEAPERDENGDPITGWYWTVVVG